MGAVTFWLGPVANFQVKGAHVPGTTLLSPSFECHNPAKEGQVTCNAMAASYRGPDGRYLPSMLKARGIDVSTVDAVYVGSFSAGHNALKGAILLSDADFALVRAIGLADSLYTSGTPSSPTPPEGYVRFAMACLDGSKMMVATSSAVPGGPGLPSGSDTIRAIVAEVEKRSGRTFAVTPSPAVAGFGAVEWGPFAGISPPPEKLYSLGTVLLADYGLSVAHGDHANVLAGQVWRDVISPWALGQLPPPPPPSDRRGLVAKVVGFGIGAAVGAAAVDWWLRRRG